MSFGLLAFSGYCCPDEKAKQWDDWENSCTRSRPGEFAADHAGAILLTELALGVTTFVLGLLSVLSVMAIPAAAGYAMLAVGAFILAMDIAALILAIKVKLSES